MKLVLVLLLAGSLVMVTAIHAQAPTQYVEYDNLLTANYGDGEQAYLAYQKSEEEKRQAARKLTNIRKIYSNAFNPCSCVSYVRWRTGTSIGPVGIARNWPTNSFSPAVGAVVVMDWSSSGHVAYVDSLDNDFLYIDHCNYKSCKCTKDKIPRDSPDILGYYISSLTN